jgi:ribulose-phosphate 3-epimerase
MVKISVSILSKNNNETILKLNKTDADYIHVDVMDGKFVDPIHFPMKQINEINNLSTKKIDVHLMVEDPICYIDDLLKFNVEYITFHYETLINNLDIIKKIKNNGIKCGLSVKPITDIKDTFYLLDDIDLILIMSVEPGCGGQDFMVSSLDKIKLLREEITKRNLKTIIAVDGGIDSSNAKLCTSTGCDMLVVGSYITLSMDYQSSIDSLRS